MQKRLERIRSGGSRGSSRRAGRRGARVDRAGAHDVADGGEALPADIGPALLVLAPRDRQLLPDLSAGPLRQPPRTAPRERLGAVHNDRQNITLVGPHSFKEKVRWAHIHDPRSSTAKERERKDCQHLKLTNCLHYQNISRNLKIYLNIFSKHRVLYCKKYACKGL